jgi:hypothetical protein
MSLSVPMIELRGASAVVSPEPLSPPLVCSSPGAVRSSAVRTARLNQNQARYSTDCSRPRSRDGLTNRGAAPHVHVRASIASYSRNVTYGPSCVLDARTNSEWIPLGRTAEGMGAATNQSAEDGYRVVRNGRISAGKSAPGVGTSLQGAKKASRNWLSRLALRMSGRPATDIS